MRNFFNRLRASAYWVSSLKMASDERYEAALQRIGKLEEIKPGNVEVTLLKAFLYFSSDKDKPALDGFLKGWRLIEESDEYSLDEKKYLQCYASFYGQKLVHTTESNGHHPFSVDYANVDLDKVRGALKDNFPLKDHPQWPGNRVER